VHAGQRPRQQPRQIEHAKSGERGRTHGDCFRDGG
jgi:hypothetical protein